MATRRTRALMEALIGNTVAIADSLKKYHPITVRQLFYQLVKDGIIEITKNEYQMVRSKTTELHRQGLLPYV